MVPYASQQPPQNPYAAPQAPVMAAGYGAMPMSAHLEGTALVVPNGAPFPAVCLKCGTPHAVEWRNQRFSYVPVWARFFGALIQVFVMKRSRFQLPLCPPCHGQWKKANLFMVLAIIVPLAVMMMAGVAAAVVGGDSGASLALVFVGVGIVGFIASLIMAAIYRRKRVVLATKIDKQFSWLSGIHANALSVITSGSGYLTPQAAPYGAPQGYGQPAMYPQPGYGPQGGYGPPR